MNESKAKIQDKGNFVTDEQLEKNSHVNYRWWYLNPEKSNQKLITSSTTMAVHLSYQHERQGPTIETSKTDMLKII